MKADELSKSGARLLSELLADHLLAERAKCIHFPHPSCMVKVELLPLPTRGKGIFETILAADVQNGVVHVCAKKKRSRK